MISLFVCLFLVLQMKVLLHQHTHAHTYTNTHKGRYAIRYLCIVGNHRWYSWWLSINYRFWFVIVWSKRLMRHYNWNSTQSCLSSSYLNYFVYIFCDLKFCSEFEWIIHSLIQSFIEWRYQICKWNHTKLFIVINRH